MRLPYLQVTQESWAKARVLAGLLGTSKRESFALICDLWAWALELGPKDQPPTGELRSARPAQALAGALEWSGPPADLLAAFADPAVDLVAVAPDGLRVRGMDRYKRTWEKNVRRKPAPVAPVTGTSHAGLAPEPARKTETEIESPPEDVQPPPADPFELKPEAAPKPRKRSEGQVFWDWTQVERTKASGLPKEDEPKPAALNAWFADALAVVKSERRLGQLFALYMLKPRDRYWPDRGWPFNGFMSDWKHYVKHLAEAA